MSGRDTLITGIGLISAAGEGIAANLACLFGDRDNYPVADAEAFAPHPVFPMVPLDLSQQIPRRGDQRQMGPWQRFGVFAAGLALADAGLTDNAEMLDQTNLIVAAGGGERDPEADSLILKALHGVNDPDKAINEALMSELRPTLFLAQLSNLLAGNISIVHHVTGSSRTLMGEEPAGAMALKVATDRIGAGQGDLFLVGSAYNGERRDMQVNQVVGQVAWDGDARAGVWARAEAGGGIVPGSMAAFLVLESRDHAVARDARRYARLVAVETDSGPRSDARANFARIEVLASKLSPNFEGTRQGYLSCASGEAVSAAMERHLSEQMGEGFRSSRRTIGSVIGHGFEAEMPAGIALAAASLNAGKYFPPLDLADPDGGGDGVGGEQGGSGQIIVSSLGHWRGEGLALLEETD